MSERRANFPLQECGIWRPVPVRVGDGRAKYDAVESGPKARWAMPHRARLSQVEYIVYPDKDGRFSFLAGEAERCASQA